MKIQLSPPEVEILIGLLSVAMEGAAVEASGREENPTSLTQAIGNAAYDAFSNLRDRLRDIA